VFAGVFAALCVRSDRRRIIDATFVTNRGGSLSVGFPL
jgi:hypothetical protein